MREPCTVRQAGNLRKGTKEVDCMDPERDPPETLLGHVLHCWCRQWDVTAYSFQPDCE